MYGKKGGLENVKRLVIEGLKMNLGFNTIKATWTTTGTELKVMNEK